MTVIVIVILSIRRYAVTKLIVSDNDFYQWFLSSVKHYSFNIMLNCFPGVKNYDCNIMIII